MISLSNDACDQHWSVLVELNAGFSISLATAIYGPAGRPWNAASSFKFNDGVGAPAFAYGLSSPSTIVPFAASYLSGN